MDIQSVEITPVGWRRKMLAEVAVRTDKGQLHGLSIYRDGSGRERVFMPAYFRHLKPDERKTLATAILDRYQKDISGVYSQQL